MNTLKLGNGFTVYFYFVESHVVMHAFENNGANVYQFLYEEMI
jgi:hypothetical protein